MIAPLLVPPSAIPLLLFSGLCCLFMSGQIHAHRFLIIAPNFLDSHFQLNAKLADILVENGHSVHFLIIKTADKEQKGVTNSKFVKIEESLFSSADNRHHHKKNQIHVTEPEFAKFTYEDTVNKANIDESTPISGYSSQHQQNTQVHAAETYHQECTYEFVKFSYRNISNELDEEENEKEIIEKRPWEQRGYKQRKKILWNEAYYVFRALSELPNINRLKEKNFNRAIADVWDIGALHIFNLVGIKPEDTYITSNISLMSFQLEYAGTLEKIQNEVPEFYSTRIGDRFGLRAGDYAKDHQNCSEKFKEVHAELDDWFNGNEIKRLYGTEDDVKTKELYASARNLFLNGDSLIDFAKMQYGKPKNAVYIGGITLEEGLLNKSIIEIRRKEAKTVLVSFDYLIDCSKMTDAILGHFLNTFNKFKQFTFKLQCKGFAEKIEKLEEQDKPENVKIALENESRQKLLSIPDNGDGTVRAFISNCSVNAATEAMAAGTPLLCMPMYVDEFYIAESLAHKGLAVPVDVVKLNGSNYPQQYGYIKWHFNNFLEKVMPSSKSQLLSTALEQVLSIKNLEKMQEFQIELHEKWDRKLPKEMFLEKVAETTKANVSGGELRITADENADTIEEQSLIY